MGYVFEGRYNRGAPRDTSYIFTIKAKDENGNYSEPSKITVQHPGIQQLVLEDQDVQGLIASIKINLPKAFSETSQIVYPYDVTSEEKDILGYRLFIQEVDDNNNPVGIEEVINYDIKELEDRIIYYQAETGKRFKVRVGAYDSVYHYDWNPSLFEQTISEPVYKETFKINFIDIDESLISPNGLTETLRNPGVDVSELQDKYTWIVGKNVDGEDIIGGIGLEVNEAEKKVDIQFVADSFRLFPTDENGDIIEGEDKAVFAVDTTPEGSTIFMDANQIGIRASKDDGSGEYNFFVLDSEGLEIFTENFKLDKNGNALFSGEIKSEKFSLNSDVVKINNDGIRVNGDGFYSRLDDKGLYLYKEGEDKPYWYCKNIASGTAQDGDYIELNWKRKPKVVTAINELTTYLSDFPSSDQIYISNATEISNDGFRVNNFIKVTDFPKEISSTGNLWYTKIKGRTGKAAPQQYITPYTDPNTTSATLYYAYDDDPGHHPRIKYKIEYKEINQSFWTELKYFYDDYTGKVDTSITISNLSKGRYAFRFTGIHAHRAEYWVKKVEYLAEVTISSGKVMWLAIEGGAD